MQDIDTKIYRPVSMPQKFVGAPLLPAVFSLCFSVLSFLFLVFYDFGLPNALVVLGFLVSIFVGHGALVMLGGKEPHMTTLIQTMRYSLQKCRRIAGKSQRRFWP
ncbi:MULTISPECIES: VirB3 family type IV secretion system protein [Microvirga]|uniref:VirB3 family type IV secretion system protein n=1 Tax=Microvirga TaxID=186650 RepID=UPI0021C8DED1|nr:MULTISPECIES: VirB3 family type IV secretion system protein [unclassified Microvirga]